MALPLRAGPARRPTTVTIRLLQEQAIAEKDLLIDMKIQNCEVKELAYRIRRKKLELDSQIQAADVALQRLPKSDRHMPEVQLALTALSQSKRLSSEMDAMLAELDAVENKDEQLGERWRGMQSAKDSQLRKLEGHKS